MHCIVLLLLLLLSSIVTANITGTNEITDASNNNNNALLSSIEKHLQLQNYNLQMQNYNLLLELTTGDVIQPSLVATNNKKRTSKITMNLGLYDVGDALAHTNLMREKNKTFSYPNCHPKTAMCNDVEHKEQQIECENTIFFSKCISSCRDKFLNCVQRYNVIQEKIPYLGRTAKYLRRELIMNPLYNEFRNKSASYKVKNNKNATTRMKKKKKKKKKPLPDMNKLIDKKMAKVTLPMQLIV